MTKKKTVNKKLGAKKKKASPSAGLKEIDLYPGVKFHLESLGYTVKGEVLDCDVTGLGPDDVLLAVELKVALNIKLILQAVERLDMVDFVYVGIPEKDGFYKKNKRPMTKLLKRLGIGLILVNTVKNTVFVPVTPTEYTPRKLTKKRARLLKEFAGLNGDPNAGGSSTRRKKMTVYRQKALQIASYLIEQGESKASVVRNGLRIENARDIMYQNHYKWFDAHGKGIYAITEKGKKEYADWQALLQTKT